MKDPFVKTLLATLILFLAAAQAFACDAAIEKFSRDCGMQDRMAKIRDDYAAIGIDVDEIGEYKVLRFIDRSSWEKAKSLKKAPTDIYDPAPATWQVWEKGIDSLFKGQQLKNVLFGQMNLDQNIFSRINTVLLTDGITSIKDKNTSQSKKPGEFRHYSDVGVGWCAGNENANNYHQGIRKSEDSMERFQKRWESLMGIEFREIVKNEDGPNWRRADLQSGMHISEGATCRGGKGVFIGYSDSGQVERQIDWIRIFIKSNLQSYQRGEPKLAPVELAAVVQKWFVSVHPFADGNGRTSRGIQELIMANFGLPFVPGGDLQNDAMEDVDVYIENTYKKVDSMLTELEMCLNKRGDRLIPRACRTIDELNHHRISDDEVEQPAQQIQNGG